MEKEIRNVNEYGAFSENELNREYVKCKELLKVYKDIIDDDKKQISELKSKLEHSNERIRALESMLGIRSAKETIELAKKLYGLNLKVPNEEEPLPFFDEQYEEKTKVELPTMPIDVASMLINATVEYQTPSICKVFGAGDVSFADKYSKNDLKEIAEHLLAYCNNSDEDDEDKKS